MSDDGVPYLLLTIVPALACVCLYANFCRQILQDRRGPGPAERGPARSYPTIRLAHLASVVGNRDMSFARFDLHPIRLARPERGSAARSMSCPSCGEEIPCVIRSVRSTICRRKLWFVLSALTAAVSGFTGVVSVVFFNPEGGPEFGIEELIILASLLLMVLLARKWQREDGVRLRGQPIGRWPPHSVKYRLMD